MKKLLSAVACALLLFCSCQPSMDVPDINKENMYFGLTMNSAMLTHKGLAQRGDTESTYVLRLATIDTNDEGEAATTRILSLDLQFNLDNGRIPEGEYSFGNLELSEGAYNNILSGSTYVNMESGDYNSYAMWLIHDGKINIKHGEGDTYIMDVDFNAKKLNKEAGVAVGKVKPIVCRYEGEVDICGLGEDFIFTTFQPYYAYAIYYPLKGGQTYWDLCIMDANYYTVFLNQQATGRKDTYSAYFAEYQLICDDNGMILPQGQFDLDTYGTLTSKTLMGAAVMRADLTETISKDKDGNDIIFINQEATSYVDMMTDGFVKLTPKGNNLYDITAETYGVQGGYKCKLSNRQINVVPGYTGADRSNVDYKFTAGMMLYMGRYQYDNGTLSVPYWYLFLYDKSRNEIVQLGVNVELGSNFESGIPTGKYLVNDSGNALTVDQGFEDQNRRIYGSCVNNGDTEVYDLITSGVLEVTKKDDGTYKFVLDMKGNNDNYIKGTYEGEMTINDNTSDNGSGGSVSAGQSEMMKVMSSKPGNSGIHHVNFAPGNRSIINNTKGFFGNYTPLR